MQQAHRSGTLKQSNKVHKSRHRSKRGIAAAVKGKVNAKEFVRRNRHILKKDERRHQALQLRRNKREEVLSKKRALGGTRNPPFLVCVVPLNAQLDVQSALAILRTCSEGAVVTVSESGILHIGFSSRLRPWRTATAACIACFRATARQARAALPQHQSSRFNQN